MSILNNYYFKSLWTDLKKTFKSKEYIISIEFLLSMSLSSLISSFYDKSAKLSISCLLLLLISNHLKVCQLT